MNNHHTTDETDGQVLKPTLGEEITELYSRVAKLNDIASALLAPAWGSEVGIIPTDHPLYVGEADVAPRVVPSPPPVDRAAVLPEAERKMLAYALDQAQEHIWSRDGFTDEDQTAVTSLRRLAAEAPTTTKPETHACGNCEGIDPDTCLMNPHRPPEQCPRSEGDGYGLQCQKPAGHNLCTFEEQPAAGAGQDGAQPSEVTVYLSTRCDACEHTLNWHRNDVGCTVVRCVCGRFQPPAEEGAQP